MKGLSTMFFVALVCLQINAMPIYDDDAGVIEDRDQATCQNICQQKKDACLTCPIADSGKLNKVSNSITCHRNANRSSESCISVIDFLFEININAGSTRADFATILKLTH